MTREQIEAHSLRSLAKEYLIQVCQLYRRAELLDPLKTAKRIEEAMRTLAQCVPEIKSLLKRENDAIDALTAKLNDATVANSTLQSQLDDANKQLQAAQADAASNSAAMADLNALLDANAPTAETATSTPVPNAAPAVTTFTQ